MTRTRHTACSTPMASLHWLQQTCTHAGTYIQAAGAHPFIAQPGAERCARHTPPRCSRCCAWQPKQRRAAALFARPAAAEHAARETHTQTGHTHTHTHTLTHCRSNNALPATKHMRMTCTPHTRQQPPHTTSHALLCTLQPQPCVAVHTAATTTPQAPHQPQQRHPAPLTARRTMP
jgi:hypothetical protein